MKCVCICRDLTRYGKNLSIVDTVVRSCMLFFSVSVRIAGWAPNARVCKAACKLSTMENASLM